MPTNESFSTGTLEVINSKKEIEYNRPRKLPIHSWIMQIVGSFCHHSSESMSFPSFLRAPFPQIEKKSLSFV